ncbi:DUF3037 domain-containing protein [Pontibacter flavimaris]|uniref:DUF3037 domain-containing protein n=1 Tax=Pontibacter flavimaris TaxID=1797110 RepID=A0A1Q5PHN4_9BACT|nr:DUF3037 domain-containing protein [Pontibacter flavimaris]OKL41734.1 hypothetical protein A3841_11965 [Pontibacter flavimaris]
MPEKHLFEYAVIRVVPRVEREEFLNVGVILLCASQGFLQTKYELDENRLRTIFPDLDLQELRERLCAFEKVCAGRKEGGPIGHLGTASRFRWLTANRSTIVQTSAVHPGLCCNPQETLDRLMQELVR